MSESLETHVFLGMNAVIHSEPMCRLLEVVERVAKIDAAVLVTGESGSGKELVARALHHYSRRATRPWVDVSCAALPEHLIESELFGHEKGAYSGADSAKPGLFEMANKGTLFLDEVGELDPRMQVKLLRVLDGVPYYRLGATRKVSVDVRVIAATNSNLGEMVKQGRFRADLFHRLSQVQIEVPPLRERQHDVLPLVTYFMRQHNPDCNLSQDARKVLEKYHWPGNVRELRNVVLKLALLSEKPEIRVADLPDNLRERDSDNTLLGNPGDPDMTELSAGMTLDSMERRMIMQVLNRTGGHQQKAAKLLGISRRTLGRKLKLYATQTSIDKYQEELV